MTNNLQKRSLSSNPSLTQELAEFKNVNRFAVSIINAIFSIVATFVSVYYFSHTVTHDNGLVSS